MDTGWNPLNRSSPSLNLLKVVMAGFLLGTTSFLAKTVLSEVIEFELISLIMVLQNPAFYVLVFTGVWGFFLLQSAIHVGKISINVAVAEGFIIIISVLPSMSTSWVLMPIKLNIRVLAPGGTFRV